MGQLSETFNIYVDRLRQGKTEEISERVSSDFLECREKDLSFDDPVDLNGEAYLAQDELVIHLKLSTFVRMPCKICNEWVKVEIKDIDFYQVEPLQAVKSGIFNYQELVREAILLEIPSVVECRRGNCPQREKLKNYFKRQEERDSFHPFADLE